MRFVYDGDPLAASPEGAQVFDERLLVDRTTNGIRNVIVHVYTGRGGSKLEQTPHEGKTHRLEVRNRRFDPHVLIAQAGDTFELFNRDPYGYNLNFNFLRSHARNMSLAAGEKQSTVVAQPEPAPIPVEGNIHPVRSYLVVLDHAFAAIGDKDGVLTIKGLPANKALVFQVIHEAAAGPIDHVRINGEKEIWKRSRFGLELMPGVNNLGEILVPADSFVAHRG